MIKLTSRTARQARLLLGRYPPPWDIAWLGFGLLELPDSALVNRAHPKLTQIRALIHQVRCSLPQLLEVFEGVIHAATVRVKAMRRSVGTGPPAPELLIIL